MDLTVPDRFWRVGGARAARTSPASTARSATTASSAASQSPRSPATPAHRGAACWLPTTSTPTTSATAGTPTPCWPHFRQASAADSLLCPWGRGFDGRVLTISEFGRRAGLSHKALRLYDVSGLLAPARSTRPTATACTTRSSSNALAGSACSGSSTCRWPRLPTYWRALTRRRRPAGSLVGGRRGDDRGPPRDARVSPGPTDRTAGPAGCHRVRCWCVMYRTTKIATIRADDRSAVSGRS